jgi:hypothetical protein
MADIKAKLPQDGGEGKTKHSQTFSLSIGGESYLAIVGAIENVPDGGYLIASSKDKQLALLYRIEFIIIITGIGGLIFAIGMASFLLARPDPVGESARERCRAGKTR